MKCVVIYYTTAGNTKAIAEYIAGKYDGKAIPAKDAKPLDLEDCDTVIFGSRVHAGNIAKPVVEFVNANKDRLKNMKTAFFLCSMFSGEKGEKQVANAAQTLGISTGTYFTKGKKLVSDPGEIDDFLAHVESK